MLQHVLALSTSSGVHWSATDADEHHVAHQLASIHLAKQIQHTVNSQVLVVDAAVNYSQGPGSSDCLTLACL
jgi:hypothetical protein